MAIQRPSFDTQWLGKYPLLAIYPGSHFLFKPKGPTAFTLVSCFQHNDTLYCMWPGMRNLIDQARRKGKPIPSLTKKYLGLGYVLHTNQPAHMGTALGLQYVIANNNPVVSVDLTATPWLHLKLDSSAEFELITALPLPPTANPSLSDAISAIPAKRSLLSGLSYPSRAVLEDLFSDMTIDDAHMPPNHA